MDKEVKWLKIIANLNFYKAKHGTAPHKPLLLLVVIDLVESGELASEVLEGSDPFHSAHAAIPVVVVSACLSR